MPPAAHGGPEPLPPFQLPLFDSFLTIAPQQVSVAWICTTGNLFTKCWIVPAPSQGRLSRSRGSQSWAFASALFRFVSAGRATRGRGYSRDGCAAGAAFSEISRLKTPFWAFYTDYSRNRSSSGIPRMHRAITVPEVVEVVPKEHQCQTLMSPLGSDLERHSSVCNEVCRSVRSISGCWVPLREGRLEADSLARAWAMVLDRAHNVNIVTVRC